MSDNGPINDLERQLIEAQAGRLPMPDFLRQFVMSKIIVPSAAEVKRGWEGFRPLVFKKDGVEFIGCFTAPERIGASAEKFPYYLEIRAAEFLKSLQPHLGIVTNPGNPIGFQIKPDGLAQIVQRLG